MNNNYSTSLLMKIYLFILLLLDFNVIGLFRLNRVEKFSCKIYLAFLTIPVIDTPFAETINVDGINIKKELNIKVLGKGNMSKYNKVNKRGKSNVTYYSMHLILVESY